MRQPGGARPRHPGLAGMDLAGRIGRGHPDQSCIRPDWRRRGPAAPGLCDYDMTLAPPDFTLRIWPAGGAGTAMAENSSGRCLIVMARLVRAICRGTCGLR